MVNPIPGLNGITGLPALSGPAQPVSQMTGLMSANRTQDSNVLGTDLGIMWDNGAGEVLTAFGDTAGLGFPNLLQGSVWAWKSNVLFRSSDTGLSDGMDFTTTPRDASGSAKELLPSPKIPGVEISKIPTAGIADGNVQVMSIMSVREWGPAGHWTTNWSQLAFSADNGENWALAPETSRPNEGGNANFQMNAFLSDGGFVYVYGTPSGRGGMVHVARVPKGKMSDMGAYEYWDGGAWIRGNPDVAKPVTDEGVGELSVQYNSYLGQYVMMTTDSFNNVILRRSPNPIGPWGPAEVQVFAHELPTAYGAYMHPWSTGPDLYFMTTQHTNYNALLLRTSLG
ncbi:DUF4185 domain-containing protein [Rhodococcus rhodnii]|nr:DUF4185 domain-containing protein [Rhodococcus rhodnii]TXG92496.1 DUF4185 domain-containing protein [Rhodococcus rhodnii]